MRRKASPFPRAWLHLLISGNRKTMVETTISAVARCLFQILPTRDDTGTPAEIFDEALAIVSKVEGLGLCLAMTA